MNAEKFAPPYFGAAYYPEDWDESEIDYDISMMKRAGVNAVRIAEFAWHKMEPEPGRFEFGWLHRVINRLYEAGIAVILGTPTATPPRWLSKLYPDVMQVDANDKPVMHGGRRHCCPNNPDYRRYSARIVERMAQEFGDSPAVIGWQIDNEIYNHGEGCFCRDCLGGFAEYLRAKYQTIDNLNRRWNLELFSQAYDSFEDIPAPRRAWHNPHLRLEWLSFQNDSHIDFVHMQAEILHRYTKAPVGTDTMPFNGMDYRRLNSKLDVVQFNHYNDTTNLGNTALWFDYLRGMCPHPFWNTETQTCWNGSTEIGQSIKPDGYCRANSFIPLALGGEANMYWIWRTHWAGHELTHGSVLDASGRPMHIFDEVRETSELFRAAGDFLNATEVKSEVGFHFSPRVWNMLLTQNVCGVNSDWVYRFYYPLIDEGLRPDVIDEGAKPDKYKVIFSPMLMTLGEDGLPEAISDWVRNGGVWVVGPLSDIRDAVGARYQHKPFGILEELTGAHWLYGIPDREHRIAAVAKDGSPFNSERWYDIFDESPENTLATVRGGHSAIDGKACVISRRVGKGQVIILGTFPGREELRRITAYACSLAGIETGRTEGGVLVSPRVGNGREGVVLVEYAGKEGAYECGCELCDVVTGERVSGKIRLSPYECRVLEKK